MSTETKNIETLKAHLAINVRNVEESTSFYKKMFGIAPVKVRTGYAKFDVQNPPLNFTLNENPFNGLLSGGALSHLGIQVASTEDVLAMRERWIEQGLITRDEMDTNCCYAIQDKTWVHDPDNNEWEVFVVKEDNLEESTACCVTDEKGNEVCATTGKIVIEAGDINETKLAASCCS
ncbi:MAG TPA: ArsI/CadI family heavy metal resistance metalloenzyme [Pyrinomonadaceae bacterium]|jgi:catechol 2,3-dioxygenase-like lactoylglutathione lyase family enzyme|nr:ArsI/CadI family heavy metal resistance metalloenzyme [Pyrinomonadaceae bacterium]